MYLAQAPAWAFFIEREGRFEFEVRGSHHHGWLISVL